MKPKPARERGVLSRHLLQSARHDSVPLGALRRSAKRAGVLLPLLSVIRAAGAKAAGLSLTLKGTLVIGITCASLVGARAIPGFVRAAQDGTHVALSASPAPGHGSGVVPIASAVATVATLEQGSIATVSENAQEAFGAARASVSSRAEPIAPKRAASRVLPATMPQGAARIEAEVATPPQRPNAASPQTSALAEIALLSEARTAIRGGSVAVARERLANYEALTIRKQMRGEADALRIDLELASGDRVAAQALARTFLTRYPSGPLAERVRRVANALAAE
jgi:hypothetical protein